MSNQLFEYYREELRYLYEQGREFSKVHAEDASLLDFDRDAREDPFVRRLVEAFAFLTARVQMKLDDDFPQIAGAMLEQLFPLATRPLPAFAVVELQPGDQIKPGGELVPRNSTRLLLENYSETTFRTCYDTRCYAVDILSCQLKRNIAEARHASAKTAVSAIKLKLGGRDDLPLDAALNDTLRFYISDQDIQYELSELIFNPLSLVAIGYQNKTGQWELPANQLRVLGFEENELVLPAFDGLALEYQILVEMFAYPGKHLFFEIPIPQGIRDPEQTEFELFLFFNTTSPRLESIVSSNSLSLNCAPVVNLFEPQPIAQPISQYCVDSMITANSGELDFEIFDLNSVSGIDERGTLVPVERFYSVQHHGPNQSNKLFYHTRRQRRQQNDGNDLYLSLVDLAMEPSSDNPFTQLLIKPLCCNRRFHDRNLVSRNSTNFKVVSGGLVNSAKRVSEWNRMLLQKTDTNYYWQLISLLNLNYLLLSEERKVETLRRMLELLDRPATAMTKSWINSIANATNERIVDRIESIPWGAVADGTRIDVSLDESRNSNRPGSWFLFSCGLNRFFSLHAGINSFTQLIVSATEDGRKLTQFSKRCGTRKLI
ncbi:MAG: type VI secretion system baseplate subunit TssF [Planctomycetota bacterium]